MGSRFRAQVAKVKRSNLGTAPHAVTVYYEEGVLLSLNPKPRNPKPRKSGGGGQYPRSNHHKGHRGDQGIGAPGLAKDKK